MRILAKGLMVASAPFLHVDYISSTQSDPALSGTEIAVIAVVGAAVLAIIATLITWGIYAIRKKKREGRSKKEGPP